MRHGMLSLEQPSDFVYFSTYVLAGLVPLFSSFFLDPSSHDFITPPASCQPLHMDQAMRSMLLVAMPSMDDVGIAPIQRGDQSRDVQIPGAGVACGQGGAAPVRPLARERGRWCESSAAMTKYHPIMMFRYRGGLGCVARVDQRPVGPLQPLLRRGLPRQQRHGQ
jgi:hypothetical protein